MKKLLCIFLVSLTVCCASRRPANFDIKTFETKEINEEVIFTLKNGTQIRQRRFRDGFSTEKQLLNSRFQEYKSYFKNSGHLKITGKNFYGFPVGNWEEYDEQGNLIKTINWDKNYAYSIYDLAKKLKNEFNVDIMHIDPNRFITLVRGYENAYYYDVLISDSSSPKAGYRVLRVDGTNGAVLSNKIQAYGHGNPNI